MLDVIRPNVVVIIIAFILFSNFHIKRFTYDMKLSMPYKSLRSLFDILYCYLNLFLPWLNLVSAYFILQSDQLIPQK
jgi:hypothetical protein